jgi:hypothetical protein
MNLSNASLFFMSTIASVIFALVGVSALGVPMNLFVTVPAAIAGSAVVALVSVFLRWPIGSAAILTRQLAVRMTILTLGPLLLLSTLLVTVKLLNFRPGERIGQILGAAATLAFKREDVFDAQLGALGWCGLAAPLEALALRKGLSAWSNAYGMLASCLSWGVSVLFSVVWAASYRAMTDGRR